MLDCCITEFHNLIFHFSLQNLARSTVQISNILEEMIIILVKNDFYCLTAI